MSVFEGRLAPSREPLAASAAAISHTGGTNETALVSIAIPPLGPKDHILVDLQWGYTNSGNNKTLRSRFHTEAGTSGTVVCTTVGTTTAADRDIFRGANRDAVNSQIWGMATGGAVSSSSGNVATSVDTSVGAYLNITAQLANSGETITLDSYLVEIVRG